jgi:hypothetical protein
MGPGQSKQWGGWIVDYAQRGATQINLLVQFGMPAATVLSCKVRAPENETLRPDLTTALG